MSIVCGASGLPATMKGRRSGWRAMVEGEDKEWEADRSSVYRHNGEIIISLVWPLSSFIVSTQGIMKVNELHCAMTKEDYD